MPRDFEDVAFVVRSKYRRAVIHRLGDGDPARPTDIAEAADHPQPHVSRALSELRERDLVELLVPEEQTQGRFYGLSPRGESVWEKLRERDRTLDYEVTDPTDTRYGAAVEYLEANAGDAFRGAAAVTRTRITLLALRDDIAAELSDPEMELLTKELIVLDFPDRYADIEFWTGAPRCEVRVFEELQILYVLAGDDRYLAVVLEPDFEFDPATLAAACCDRITDPAE